MASGGLVPVALPHAAHEGQHGPCHKGNRSIITAAPRPTPCFRQQRLLGWVGLGWVGSGLVVRAGLTGFIFSPDRTVPSLLFSGLGLGLGQEHLFSDTIPEDQRQTTCHVEDDVIVNQF